MQYGHGSIGARIHAAMLAIFVTGVALPDAGLAEAAEDRFAGWEQEATRNDELAWAVYVESDPAPGVPAFRIETSFEVPPSIASRTLMAAMADGGQVVGEPL